MNPDLLPAAGAAVAPALQTLADEAAALLRQRFGAAPGVVVAAPGRVNLIGEHVDYNDGFVLPMAIERYVVLAAARTERPVARFASSTRDGLVEVPLDAEPVRGEPAWANYVRGVVAGFRRRCPQIPGFDAVVHADLPAGGGLSSSAALEVSSCLLLETLAGQALPALERIQLCQKAEHEYAGVPCGIMDQFCVVSAQADHLLLLDCQSLAARHVPFDDPSVAVLVTHCGVAHELGKGEYAKRRADCHHAAEVMGVPSLRAARREQLEAASGRLTATEVRRARHVLTEIERTPAFAQAVETRAWARAGELMYASHASLRDDYEVSCDELDILVDLARGLGPSRGVWGSRLTGGGFGGCTVTLVKAEAAAQVEAEMARAYQARTGIQARCFATRPAAGAHLLAR